MRLSEWQSAVRAVSLCDAAFLYVQSYFYNMYEQISICMVLNSQM